VHAELTCEHADEIFWFKHWFTKLVHWFCREEQLLPLLPLFPEANATAAPITAAPPAAAPMIKPL